MSSPQTVANDSQESLDTCVRIVAGIFHRDDTVWITEAVYEANGPVWRVTLICPGDRGGWARRRYRFDIPSQTLHFTGSTPAGDDELAAARRSGRRL
jgi:hypothetical protein